MKKLLILGGSYFQIPAINYAKSRGYHVITCDYLPNNPGHKLADEYHNVSTTDKDAVLELARSLQVDGILCFASDPAAPTAAYVSEKLDLPGNSYDNICKFGEKHKWRKFLKQNGFNTPKAESYTSYEQIDISDWSFPIMVKPIDSSGSKGITKICQSEDLEQAFNYALTFSRAKIIIIEEFIERVGPQIGGDGFFGTDKLDFVCYGDQIVDKSLNGIVPCGMTFPAKISDKLKQRITEDIERAIRLSGLRNLSFNLEVMLDKDENIYLMELGPRNGGNCIPEVIQYYTGVNMVALAVEAAMGKSFPIEEKYSDCVYAYYALHSSKAGVYEGFEVSSMFEGKLLMDYIFLNKGEKIGAFTGSNQTIGILLMEFKNQEQMDSFFLNTQKYIKVNILS